MYRVGARVKTLGYLIANCDEGEAASEQCMPELK